MPVRRSLWAKAEALVIPALGQGVFMKIIKVIPKGEGKKMRSISKTGMWVIALVLLNFLILQNVHADRQFLRPFHNAADRRAARSGGGGGGGGGGSYQSGGGGNCYRPCGKSGGYSQEGSDSAAQKSGGRSGSSSSDSSSKAAEFSTTCTSYTTRIEAGGQTLTLEKVPNQKGQKHQFNAGDTSQSPQEVITQAKTMLNDPSVRVITDSRYPSNIDAQVARADTWKTASGERAGNIPDRKSVV